MTRKRYDRPQLARLGNLKKITAHWQCSLGFEHDERDRERERENRGGHGRHHD